MTLSKRGDYVVRSALALARAYPSGRPRKIREVVAEMGVPQTFASQILADLVRAGLATSRAGKDGGYRLARPPEEISLVEVVEAGEGPLRAERCALGDGPCRWEAVCPLHDTWRAATEALREVLATTSLADLAASDTAIAEGRAEVPADSHRHGGPSLAVADFVQIELGAPVLAGRLVDDAVVGAALGAALAEAETLRAELGGAGPRWWPATVAASCGPRGPGGPEGAEAGADGVPGPVTAQLELSFEAESTAVPVARGELGLVVRPLDPDRAELRAEGRLRLALGAEVPPTVAERLAHVVLRTFLRRLAQAVEHPEVDGRSRPRARGRARATRDPRRALPVAGQRAAPRDRG